MQTQEFKSVTRDFLQSLDSGLTSILKRKMAQNRLAFEDCLEKDSSVLKIVKELECSVCLQIVDVDDAVSCGNCQNICDFACINKNANFGPSYFIEIGMPCPICKHGVKSDARLHRVLKNTLKSARFTCNLCKEAHIEYEKREVHVAQCKAFVLDCPFRGCPTKEITFRDLKAHLKSGECQSQLLKCQDCNYEVYSVYSSSLTLGERQGHACIKDLQRENQLLKLRLAASDKSEQSYKELCKNLLSKSAKPNRQLVDGEEEQEDKEQQPAQASDRDSADEPGIKLSRQAFEILSEKLKAFGIKFTSYPSDADAATHDLQIDSAQQASLVIEVVEALLLHKCAACETYLVKLESHETGCSVQTLPKAICDSAGSSQVSTSNEARAAHSSSSERKTFGNQTRMDEEESKRASSGIRSQGVEVAVMGRSESDYAMLDEMATSQTKK